MSQLCLQGTSKLMSLSLVPAWVSQPRASEKHCCCYLLRASLPCLPPPRSPCPKCRVSRGPLGHSGTLSAGSCPGGHGN